MSEGQGSPKVFTEKQNKNQKRSSKWYPDIGR